MPDVTSRDGIVHGLAESIYHRGPELSSTGARQILESPARYQYNQTHPQPHKDAYDLGTAVHTRVLGTGVGVVTYPDAFLTVSGNPSTKPPALAWADEQRANGLVVIGAQQAAQVDGMAEAVLAHPEARQVLETVAGREVSAFATVEGVRIRARFDIYNGTHGADLKTTRDASPKGFNAAVARYGYHIQEQLYREAHTAITGTELDSFRFIVVENVAPYLVGVYDLDFMWEDLAKERTRKAREVYRQCVETGEWPGYPSATLTPPAWAIYENEEEEIQV